MSLPPQPPTSASDVIAVLDQDFNQVFAKARPLKLALRETAKVMDHPVEDGTTITDHIVVQPVEAKLSLMIVGEAYRDLYAEIKELFLSATLLTVQTRSGSYGQMMISDLPHEETADIADGFALALKLREVKLIKPEYGKLPPAKVSNKSQSSTVDRGQQNGTAASSSQGSGGSALYSLFKGR